MEVLKVTEVRQHEVDLSAQGIHLIVQVGVEESRFDYGMIQMEARTTTQYVRFRTMEKELKGK